MNSSYHYVHFTGQTVNRTTYSAPHRHYWSNPLLTFSATPRVRLECECQIFNVSRERVRPSRLTETPLTEVALELLVVRHFTFTVHVPASMPGAV